MLLPSAAGGRSIACGVNATVSLLLLVIYVAGTSRLDVFHRLTHSHHHSVLHSDEQEKDPCHRAVYHANAGDGCGHQSHIVITDRCELCDMIVHADEIFLAVASTSSARFPQIIVTCPLENKVIPGLPALPARAPPFMG